MSGFFSLGGGGSGSGKDQDQEQPQQQDHHHHHHHHHHHQQQQQQQQLINPTNNNNNNNSNSNSLFLFKNEEIYNKGFELWQQSCQPHQQRLHHHHQQHQNHHSIQDVDFSVGPSTRIRNNNNDSSSNNIVNIGHSSDIDDSCDYSGHYRSSTSAGLRMMRASGRSSSGHEGINCQDCGNQAKKDCVHLRCRTCCKSRGLPCQTHVKSTWVAAAKRRERQQQLAALQDQQQQQQALTIRSGGGGGDQKPKRMRENPGGGGGSALVACAATTSRLTATTSGFELGNFPAEVNSPAVFRCVRVSAVDDAEEHLAYQTAVNIGGHVFKGILYDQGPYPSTGRERGGGSQQHQQPLDLIAAAAASEAAAATTATASNPNIAMLDQSIYPTPLTAFMAGTQFFPPPRH